MFPQLSQRVNKAKPCCRRLPVLLLQSQNLCTQITILKILKIIILNVIKFDYFFYN